MLGAATGILRTGGRRIGLFDGPHDLREGDAATVRDGAQWSYSAENDAVPRLARRVFRRCFPTASRPWEAWDCLVRSTIAAAGSRASRSSVVEQFFETRHGVEARTGTQSIVPGRSFFIWIGIE